MKRLWLLLALPIVLADQLIKWWTVNNLQPFERQPLFPGFLELRRTFNTGAGFSLLADTPGSRWILTAVSALASAFIIFAVCKKMTQNTFGIVSLALVLGGAVGNLIDRALVGGVVDMLNFTFINFPVFNVADIFITVGGICFCAYLIFIHPREAKKNAPLESDG